MASISGAGFSSISKYKISRRGRKLQATDDQRTLVALPKDVPERIWAELLQKEENDLFLFELREELVVEALRVGYARYMERQTALFTAHCAARAWLKLIDWHFYRHDPGEDPSAYPPCFIPKRAESWAPDQLPDPSPKDTWCRHDLNVVEDTPDEALQSPIARSLDVPVVEEIPSEYWFPGKVSVPEDMRRKCVRQEVLESGGSTTPSEEELATESEVLQKVTDYSAEELLGQLSNKESKLAGPRHGAGDSLPERPRPERRHSEKSNMFSRPSPPGRLPALGGDSRSRLSIISDCRLRSLRLETQYEISSEKMVTPPGETAKRR